ncbi:MAG: hypothetical protein M3186_13200, partial [Actinomycetota bacterium]|nr:hypothetical protein [Actinomycetota bacterium]
MFDKVLVANRGEIAIRVIRTLRAMGIGSVAVYSDADSGARHVREADIAVRLDPAPTVQGDLDTGSAGGVFDTGSAGGDFDAGSAGGYLSIQQILDAAARAGARAIHPGYGFLSENAAFARACAAAGLAFVGPPASVIETMGDKIRAKATVAAAGVPVLPGSDGDSSDEALTAAAAAVGYPVLLKPSCGGGGKGLR